MKIQTTKYHARGNIQGWIRGGGGGGGGGG